MNSTSINNLLQIVSPTSPASVVSSGGSKEFDRYLQKATAPVTTAEKPTPKREPEAPQTESAHESEATEPSTQEQAASSDDQGGTTNKANEQPIASEKEQTSEESDTDQDEVVLSDAALASASVQHEKSAAQDSDAENGELETVSSSIDQESNQAGLKGTNETAEANPAIEEIDHQHKDSNNTHEAKFTSEEGAQQGSDAVAARNAKQTENNETKHARDGGVPTGVKQDSRSQGASDGNPGTLQDIPSPNVNSNPETSTATQLLATAVGDVTDSSAATVSNNNLPSSPVPGSANSVAAPSVPSPNQHRSEASITQAGHESAGPSVDRGRFVQRVANAFRSAQQNDGEIQLRLSPPELGSLKIGIAVRHGVLTAKLEAETVEARHTLLENLPALRQRLAEQDIRIEKFEVDIRRDGGQGQAGAEDRQSRDGSNRNGMTPQSRINAEPEVTTSRVPRSAMSLTPDSLDVRI